MHLFLLHFSLLQAHLKGTVLRTSNLNWMDRKIETERSLEMKKDGPPEFSEVKAGDQI